MHSHTTEAQRRKLLKSEPEIELQWIGAAIKMDAGNALSPEIGKVGMA